MKQLIRRQTILIWSIIIVISLFTLSPTFHLALLGDDWLAFFRFRQHVDPGFSQQWNYLTYFLTPYGVQDIMMGILQKIFGYSSTYYYLTSYILRVLAAISLFPLVFYLTKSKLSAFFASLFFSITVIGFDTTNWSSNMTSYITIALFNLFLYYFLKSREEKKVKLFSFAAILYYLAYVTTPIRMHGSLPFIFLLEAFWAIQKRSLNITKMAALRLSIILVVFLIIRFTGQSQGPPQEPTERFMIGLTQDMQMLSQGRFDFIFYPIVMFGSMLIPDLIEPQGQINALRQLLPLFVSTGLIFSIIAFFVIQNVGGFRSKFFINLCLTLGLWAVSVTLIYKGNQNFFNNTNQIFPLLIGGYTLILISFLIIKFFREKYIAQALFLGSSWSIISFFFAWWWVPQSIFPTTYRYLIVSAIGISVLLATVISLGKDKKSQLSLLVPLCLILILHIISDRLYINSLLNSHGQDISNKIWASIPHVEEIGKSKEPIIFYFEGDGTNGGILHDVITFGFPPHMALLYSLREENPLPIPMSNWQEVVSAVRDGKSFPAYGYPAKPITPDRVYAFQLQGKDNLISVTDQARKRLQEEI